MNRKIVSGIMLTLLLISMLVLVFNIQPAVASGTVYIRADGSIDPPTANITSVDNVTYTLTGNINDSIVVERDNIVLDGAGYTVQGTGIGNGIYLSGRSNVTIKNINVKAFDWGIRLESSSDNSISRNNITNDGYGTVLSYSSNNSIVENNIKTSNNFGIYLAYSLNNSISGNNITKNIWGGINLYYSSNNSIVENNITNNVECGIRLLYSSNNTFRSNIMADNKFNFDVWGGEFSHFLNDVDISNTVDSKPIYYWINKRDVAVPLDAGCVVLVNCTGIETQNLNLANNGQGILLAYSNNTSILQNNITNNQFGILSYSSSSNAIARNNITNNYYGIYLAYSLNNSISGNNITKNIWGGINLYYSSNNVIYHNNFINNTIYIPTYGYANVLDGGYPSGGNYWSDYTGIDVKRGPNQDQSESDGIGDTPRTLGADNQDRYPLMKPYPWDPHDIGITSIVTSKTVVVQGYNLAINITIFNYGNNTGTFKVFLCYDEFVISTPEQWDAFWSMGDVDRDGIVDFFDVGTIAVNVGWTGPPGENPADIDSDGDVDFDDLSICSSNLGLDIWTAFELGTPPIGTQTINYLPAGSSVTVALSWNTTGFAKGIYTISAYVWSVQGETDLADNTYTDGTVRVTMIGDCAPEFGIVDIFDIAYVAICFGAQYGEPPPPGTQPYNPNADIIEDKIIDIFDIAAVAVHFGEKDS